MPTPSIQTLVTSAQQVLNLDSISAVRSVVAVALANANTGTPLNPNLTTQQLWNEFYQVVTKPKSDIESIIANQLMKFLYAPPAPGGVGANGQVIFNDNGVLSGDAGLTYNKATGALTITGDLTVDTNVLKVDSLNNRVGIGTASPLSPLHVFNGNILLSNAYYLSSRNAANTTTINLIGRNASDNVVIDADGYGVLMGAGSALQLTGSGNLGLGVTPSAWISAYKALEIGTMTSVYGRTDATAEFSLSLNGYRNSSGSWIYKTNNAASRFEQAYGTHVWYTAPSGTAGNTITFTQAMTLDASGNLLVGTTSQVGRLTVRTATDNTTIAQFGATNRWVNFTTSANAGTDNGFFNFVSTSAAGAFSFQNANGTLWQVDNSGNMIPQITGTAPTLSANGQMVFSLTTNTNLRISVRGTDGTTRTANITLA